MRLLMWAPLSRSERRALATTSQDGKNFEPDRLNEAAGETLSRISPYTEHVERKRIAQGIDKMIDYPRASG
jgi:hypothetical protein